MFDLALISCCNPLPIGDLVLHGYASYAAIAFEQPNFVNQISIRLSPS